MLNGPILPNALGAVPLLIQPDLKLTPADDPMWDKNDHNGISDEFVWNNTASPFLLIYLSRLALHLHQLAAGRVDLPLGVRARRSVGGCLCADAVRLRSESAGAFASGDDRLRADGDCVSLRCMLSIAGCSQMSSRKWLIDDGNLDRLDAGLEVLA